MLTSFFAGNRHQPVDAEFIESCLSNALVHVVVGAETVEFSGLAQDKGPLVLGTTLGPPPCPPAL